MSPIELAKKLSLKILVEGCGNEREITSIYCCDLLSIVMGRAKENSVWITVMGNQNAVAVASLSDVSCILLSEGMTFDDEGIQKAREQEICVLMTDKPTFEIAMEISEEIK